MIDYKGFIEHYFHIKSKEGEIVPFIFNPTQDLYYKLLLKDYGATGFQGIRENDLKARREGMSSLWEGIFTVDFLQGALGNAPITGSQVVSHKDKETKPHFQRIDLFVNTYLQKTGLNRKFFLDVDNKTSYICSKNYTEFFVGSAGAKVLGRGGDTNNLLFTEVGFYPNTPIINAEDLVTGAEQQVPMGRGKIVRESTGNVVGDFFCEEWYRGQSEWSDKEPKDQSVFKSRFFPWFIHKDYRRPAPPGFKFPQVLQEIRSANVDKIDSDQLYWYYLKSKEFKDPNKFYREYPSTPEDGFLSGGSCFFDIPTLRWYLKNTKKPIQEGFLAPSGVWI